jgi:two-component system, NarL family, nitrate/nitrite response regulator NarL
MAACLSAQPEFAVVGHVGTDEDLLRLCRLRRIDLVLYLADEGIYAAGEGIGRIRSACPNVRVVLAYDQLDPGDLPLTRPLGVDSLVPTSHGLDAVLTIMRQQVPEPPRAEVIIHHDVLTDEEREILALVGAGHPAARVADLLGLTAAAVENGKRRIYRKLDAANQGHAIARAASLGLIGRPSAVRPSPSRSGEVPLAILRGIALDSGHEVIATLLAAQIAFVVDTAGSVAALGTWERQHPGPVLLVLVDPGPDDWNGVHEVTMPVVLVRSAEMRREEALEALRRGVAAIIPSEQVAYALVPALTLAMTGHVTVGPVAAGAVVAAAKATTTASDGALPVLTTREGEILSSIARGDTVRQTARTLGIAEKTVENTQARLFRKLGARNRAGALANAHELGLVDLVDQ